MAEETRRLNAQRANLIQSINSEAEAERKAAEAAQKAVEDKIKAAEEEEKKLEEIQQRRRDKQIEDDLTQIQNI